MGPEPSGATRRQVLTASVLAAVAAGAAGCTAGTPWPWAKPPRPAPDVALLRHVIDAEYAMISRYTTALSARAELTAVLSPVLTEHRAHLAQLRARLVIPPGASASESAAAAPPRLPRPRVPASQRAALGYLRAAELAQASALVGWLTAAPPALAQLLASISASETSHAELLGSARSAR